MSESGNLPVTRSEVENMIYRALPCSTNSNCREIAGLQQEVCALKKIIVSYNRWLFVVLGALIADLVVNYIKG